LRDWPIIPIFAFLHAGMQYYPVPDSLSPLIESIWSFESPEQLPEHEQALVIPTGKCVLLWNYQSTYEHVVDDTVFHHPLYDLHLVGPHNKNIVLRGSVPVSSIGITFRPYGYYAIAGAAMPTLVNRVASISRLKRDGSMVLDSCTGLPADSIGSLLQLLAERIQFAADGRVISAVDAIDQHKGNIRIREVFENIPGSQRHLNKLFKQQVGLTPKEYASIVRLQAMYNLYIRDHQRENKDHQYDLYYDESHFLQNFRKVFAQRPRQFMRAPNQLGNAFNK